MKYITSLLLAVTMLTTSSFAQRPAKQLWPDIGNVHPPVSTPHQSARITTSDMRVIACTGSYYQSGNYIMLDSLSYSYTSGLGSSPFIYNPRWQINYDTSIQYNSSLQPVVRHLQTFDPGNNLLSLTEIIWNAMTTSWDNAQRAEYTYDANSNPLSVGIFYWDGVSSAWQESYSLFYAYNAANQITQTTQLQWNTATLHWDSTLQEFTTYDAAGNKLIKLSRGMYMGAWADLYKTVYTNDVAGNCIDELFEFWDPTLFTWQNDHRHRRTFNATNNTITDTTINFDGIPGTWVPDELITYSSYSGNNPGTVAHAYWDTTTHVFNNSRQDSFAYNSSGQPDYYFYNVWNSATATWTNFDGNERTHYYYEQYDLAIDLRSKNEPELTLAPVPVQGNLNISLRWAHPQPFTIHICDAAGKEYYSESIAEINSFKGSIPVNALPPGSYIIRFAGPLQQCTRLITVAR